MLQPSSFDGISIAIEQSPPSGYGMKAMFERAYLASGIPLERVNYMGE